MNWFKVIVALESAASEHQDKANLFAARLEKDSKQKAMMYDVSANLLRVLAFALKRGTT